LKLDAMADSTQRRYFWTKVWGAPHAPEQSALLFNSEGARDTALGVLKQGDIVVYLTSDRAESDPNFRGRVSGAVEIEGNPVIAADLGILERSRPQDFREDGRFRWPFGVSITRCWRVVDQESSNNLIPTHAEKGIAGAITVHEMSASEISRFQSLRVEEQTNVGPSGKRIPFRSSLRSTFNQHEGIREGSEVHPGSGFYIAVISDEHGLTYKVGSGKIEERIDALNRYRRPSQGESVWSVFLRYDLASPENARAAEDYFLRAAIGEGHGSPDHSEFLTGGMSVKRLNELFSAAVEAAGD
jgi:hypothetical protein